MCDTETKDLGFVISDKLSKKLMEFAELSTWGIGILQVWLNAGLDKEILDILGEYYAYLEKKSAK